MLDDTRCYVNLVLATAAAPKLLLRGRYEVPEKNFELRISYIYNINGAIIRTCKYFFA